MNLKTGFKFKDFIPIFFISCLLCKLALGSKKHTNFDDTKVLVEIMSQAKEVRTKTNPDGSIVFLDTDNNLPFLGSGWIYELRINGTIMGLGKLKKGMLNGVVASWYSNGNKKAEETFEHGKLINVERWKPNGLKCNQTKVENGNGQTFEYGSECNVISVRFWKGGIVVKERSLLNPAK
jgi:antitoxin component YwqK of YwqJK toxin-antitoxin module